MESSDKKSWTEKSDLKQQKRHLFVAAYTTQPYLHCKINKIFNNGNRFGKICALQMHLQDGSLSAVE